MTRLATKSPFFDIDCSNNVTSDMIDNVSSYTDIVDRGNVTNDISDNVSPFSDIDCSTKIINDMMGMHLTCDL